MEKDRWTGKKPPYIMKITNQQLQIEKGLFTL